MRFALWDCAHFCSLCDGTGWAGCLDGSGVAGWRKGSEPLGEAWLFEGAIRMGMWEKAR